MNKNTSGGLRKKIEAILEDTYEEYSASEEATNDIEALCAQECQGAIEEFTERIRHYMFGTMEDLSMSELNELEEQSLSKREQG